MKTLFDSFERVNNNFAKYITPQFRFLNESAQKKSTNIRKILDNWFSFYPKSNSREFTKRFRSVNNDDHKSAFFELFIFTLFRNLGSKIEVHPSLDNRKKTKPDFKVKLNSIEFIVECCLSGDPNIDEKIQSHINNICDKLNSFKSEYHFFVDFIKSNKNSPSDGKLLRFIQSKIKLLNNEIVTEKDDIKWSFESNGWKIEIKLVSKPKEFNLARNVGLFKNSPLLIDSKKKIIHAIKNKTPAKYGNFKLPYIIAVNSQDIFLNFDEFEEILFNQKNNLFIRNNEIINKRISGLLFCEGINPLNYNKAKFRLLINPWAIYPISQEIIPIDESRYLTNGLEIKKRIDIIKERNYFN